MNKKDKIYIAGHSGIVGSAITRKLEQVKNKHRINIASTCNESEYHLVLKIVNHN